MVFDINDLDETLPAPWEWDVKRLAASFVLACRDNGFSKADARDAAIACARSYRERMAEFSEMRTLDVWYASIDALDRSLPFAVLKAKSHVNDRAKAANDDPRFSIRIRDDLPRMVPTAAGKR